MDSTWDNLQTSPTSSSECCPCMLSQSIFLNHPSFRLWEEMFLSSYPWTRWNLPRFHSHLKIRGVLRMQGLLIYPPCDDDSSLTTRAGRILWCCSLILLLITHYFLFFKVGVGGSIFYHSVWFLDFFKLMQDLQKKKNPPMYSPWEFFLFSSSLGSISF